MDVDLFWNLRENAFYILTKSKGESSLNGEARAISKTKRPATVRSLRDDLRSFAVPEGAAVLVHSSLSALGWVAGGAQAVVKALVDVFATRGTLVMPTHSADLSDPSMWENPPVPQSWWETIRNEAPAFDPALTPTRAMGVIVECFRHVPGVRRSTHPTSSFAALGADADRILDGHTLEHGLGEGSPLARLYDLDGYVLLLGVGFDRCTSLHLAEYRANYPKKTWFTQASPVLIDGVRKWVQYQELEGDTGDFERLGEDYEAKVGVRTGQVGAGHARLIRQRHLVDFAVDWFEANRR